MSEELIEKVRSGNWKPDENSSDKDDKAALAARGYWQAFQEVKKSLRTILGGANAGTVVEKDHRIWYQEKLAISLYFWLLLLVNKYGVKLNRGHFSGPLRKRKKDND